MGEEDEREASFPALNLPFLHISAATMDSPEHPSGMATPPLQTSAAVPFKWEEQPGRPRSCSDIIPARPPKTLELPPCRNRILFSDPADKINKTPSPTTVLDGPYNVGRPKFSSFRFFREPHDHSFDRLSSASPDGTASDLLLGGKKSGGGVKARGFFGRFKGGKREFDGGSCRFSPSSISSCESYESCTTARSVKNGGGVKMRRNGSFSSVSHAKSSHLWTSICEGIKQVIQWKSSRKSNKQGRD